MFRLFQLKNLKILSAFILSAVFCMPLTGSMFADEWNLDNVRMDSGKILKITEEFKQGDVEHYFDNAGRKILRTFPDAATAEKVEFKMTYGQNGKLAKVECLIKGKLVFVENGSYDDEGILRGIIRSNADGKEEFATTMLVYDDKMQNLKSYGVQTSQGIVDYFYEYDENGRLNKVRAMSDRKLISAAEYSYDSNGFIVEVRRMNENLKIVGILRNFWETDKKGNWIKKTSALYANLAKRPVFAEMITRKIEYAK